MEKEIIRNDETINELNILKSEIWDLKNELNSNKKKIEEKKKI